MNIPADKHIAVVGSGISGLSAAWLLSQKYSVTLFEKDDRFGGHSNTVVAKTQDGHIPVDTGFIVYNPVNYPNLTALFDYLKVDTVATDMSFAVSAEGGKTEYNGNGLGGIFSSFSNIVNPRIWRMLLDILRFYRQCEHWPEQISEQMTLGELLKQYRFSDELRDLHLVPMGAAIWSTPASEMLDYPALSFLRFCQNHGLLQVNDRPQWHTVKGGSREYVRKLINQIQPATICNRGVRQIIRHDSHVELIDSRGEHRDFDDVVLACHADQALALLSNATEQEQHLLGAFSYQRNRAILHSDTRLMPKNRKVWSSWNYLSDPQGQNKDQLAVSYWMNLLQPLATEQPLIVTLNPPVEPEEGSIHCSFLYDHPVFSREAIAAQLELHKLQGQHRTWFCGSYFGYGFHEDGLQSGLAVAEAMGAPRRPWNVAEESGRIHWPGLAADKADTEASHPVPEAAHAPQHTG
ncbi:NAD(P)/FAD-dependent oxidoreductase [Oceanospirillum sediminis]|uniref:FAD-dependent oxidoreductase n=1 Tax=Oceanospirillum sediminis TaxID=2760088 RepID=A0A839INB7_9GAMM|nr:FAD-dependent oxidoreductase [Oceanospirillum sediminis]MBB1486715.1 FAD-dependent oxidoreductase [Oceanospirillum sediminis]